MNTNKWNCIHFIFCCRKRFPLMEKVTNILITCWICRSSEMASQVFSHFSSLFISCKTVFMLSKPNVSYTMWYLVAVESLLWLSWCPSLLQLIILGDFSFCWSPEEVITKQKNLFVSSKWVSAFIVFEELMNLYLWLKESVKVWLKEALLRK